MNEGLAVLLLALALAALWRVSLWLYPWRTCPRCKGRGRIAPEGGGIHGDCGKCGTKGRLRRFGAGQEKR